MSSFPTRLRKRDLQSRGYFRQTVTTGPDGHPKPIEGLGPVRRPDGSLAGMSWATAR